MLRQLARLTRRVPAAGPRALAIAVYADAGNDPLVAAESGPEGVACVDDAARACAALAEIWAATRLPWVGEWARGVLDFVLWMRAGDGLWLNFISNWSGARNPDGITSRAGLNFWQARAVAALSVAAPALGDERAARALAEGLDAATQGAAPADVRALHAVAAMAELGRRPDPATARRLSGWCAEIAGCRRGDVLLNWEREAGPPHLWGHIQEGVLAGSGSLLGRPDLTRAAVRSAALVWEPVIRAGFVAAHVQPYAVASAVYVTDRLAQSTGEPRYRDLRDLARLWFHGRNPAREPVYEPGPGRVRDGIDEAVLNAHSGAESNIEAALALPDLAVDLVRRRGDAVRALLPAGREGVAG